MTKDLAYYRMLPYEREWLPRDDESGRYLVVRLEDIPDIYGSGNTRQEALAALRSAFDDQITWCLEENVEIPEPSVIRPAEPKTIEIRVEMITSDPVADIWQAGVEIPPSAAESTESYRGSIVEDAELEEVAA